MHFEHSNVNKYHLPAGANDNDLLYSNQKINVFILKKYGREEITHVCTWAALRVTLHTRYLRRIEPQ